MNVHKLVKRLEAKYSKDELADLLLKHKDQKVSNAICGAYNQKCLPTNQSNSDSEKTKVWDFYHAQRRAIGPESWFYNFMVVKESETLGTFFLLRF